MGAMMLTHVNEHGCLCDGQNSGIKDCRRTADKGNHRTIGGFTGVDIQQFHAIYFTDFIRDLPDHILVTPLTEVGYALYDLLADGHSIIFIMLIK